MSNVRDARTAKATVLIIRRKLDDIKRLSAAAPGLVRVATGERGDTIVFWNSGSTAMEFNASEAQRMIDSIARSFPEALRTRSGQLIDFRIELPLQK